MYDINNVPKKKNKQNLYAFKKQEKDETHTIERCAENIAFIIATYLKGAL